jgi:hypothetical protein
MMSNGGRWAEYFFSYSKRRSREAGRAWHRTRDHRKAARPYLRLFGLPGSVGSWNRTFASLIASETVNPFWPRETRSLGHAAGSGSSSRCPWSVPTALRTCASSRSSPRPRPSSASSLTSVSRHAQRRSRPHADRTPGTMLPSRCRTGASSNSPSPTSSPARLSAARCGAGAHPSTRKRARPHRARRPSAPQSGVDGVSHPRYASSSGQSGRSGRLGFPIRHAAAVWSRSASQE